MRIKTFQIVLLLLAITMAACGPEFIDQHDRIKVTTESDIHSGPGQQYKKIDTAKAGAELILLESENDWHRVRLPNGRTGWIFRGVTRSIAPEKVVMTQDARIRRGPGEEYKAFAIAQKGKTLDARGQRGNWYLVDLPNGQSGWISKVDAQKVDNLNLTATQKAKIYQLPNPNSVVLLYVDPGTELIQLEKQGDYYMVRLPGGDTGWIQKDYVNPVKEKTLVVKEKADIKYGPSIQYEKVETAEKGTRLTLLNQKDDWYEVRAPDGKTGWIYKDFIVQTYTTQGYTVDEVPLYYMTNTDCNIRQGDGTNYPILDRVKKGTIMVKIGQQGDWYKVRLPDQRIGWIREDLADYNSSILVTIDNCNIRLGPSTDFRVKTTVPRGTPLAKISEKDGWSQVNLPDGEVGWIRNDLRADPDQSLFVKEECNVRDGPGTNYQQIDRLPTGTAVIKLDKKNDWYQVQLPSKRIGWIREDLLRDTPNQMVTNDRVNIRMGPGLVYQVITQLEKNTPVTVVGEQDNWYQIKLTDGRTGWIRKDLVSFSYYPTSSYTQPGYNGYESYSVSPVSRPKSGSQIGSMSVSTTPTKTGVKMTTTSAVNLRLGPSTSESIIKLLPAGTPVIRIDQEGEWYEIQTDDGILGFAHESGFSTSDKKLYTNTKCNIRFGPSTDYRIVATLPEKTELTKIEQRDNWINVQLANGQKGWIRNDLVTGTAVPPPLLPQKTELVSGSLMTTGDAKILGGPDNTHPTVKSVKINTELKTISKYKNWYEVETLDGEKGWIADQYVKEKDNKKIIVIRKSEVYQSSNTQSGIITIVDVGEYYTPLNQEVSWYRIPVKPGITGWIPAQNVLDLKYPPVYVNTTTADVMKFADEKSTKIAVVKEGVQLVPIDETDDWLFIELPRGDRGWIKKRLVDRQKLPHIKILRDTEAYEQPTAGSLLKATMMKDDSFLALDLRNNWYKILLRGSEIGWVYGGYVKEDTKGSLLVKENSFLRMGPGLDYRIITTVPGGQKVKWLDQKGDWNQVQIESGEVGWIYEQLAKNVTMTEMTAQANSTVYAGPGTNFAKVGEVVRGRKYAPMNKKPDWYEIQLTAGTTGWVAMDVFSPKKSRVVFTLDKANIRSGPGMYYDIVQTLQPAVDVTVLRTEGDWYYVQLQDGKRGYIRKDLVFEE
jgi:uncharacterized protein YgiM (DUF1202 family)